MEIFILRALTTIQYQFLPHALSFLTVSCPPWDPGSPHSAKGLSTPLDSSRSASFLYHHLYWTTHLDRWHRLACASSETYSSPCSLSM